MATLEQALDQMLRDGMPPMPSGHPRFNAARIVRYGPRLRAWYRLYEQFGRNGAAYISGVYGYWGLLPEGGVKIESRFDGLDRDELERFKAAQSAAEAREREKREARARNAANRAAAQWRQATKDGFSEYLKRKQVEPERGIGLRFAADGALLVPALRYDQIGGNGKPRLVSLQKIAPDGSKRFSKDAAIRGAAFRIGAAPENGEPILIAEGLATGLSIRKAIDRSRSVYVAFDCGNLAELARMLRELYPQSPILFCADDDFLTPCARHKNEGIEQPIDPDATRPAWCRCNPGRTHAKLAAAAIGKAHVIAPHFVNRKRAYRLPDPDDAADWQRSSSEWRQYSVFVMGKRPPDESEDLWIRKNVGAWRKAAREYGRFGRTSSSDEDAADEAARSVREARSDDPAI